MESVSSSLHFVSFTRHCSFSYCSLPFLLTPTSSNGDDVMKMARWHRSCSHAIQRASTSLRLRSGIGAFYRTRSSRADRLLTLHVVFFCSAILTLRFWVAINQWEFFCSSRICQTPESCWRTCGWLGYLTLRSNRKFDGIEAIGNNHRCLRSSMDCSIRSRSIIPNIGYSSASILNSSPMRVD